MCFDERTERIRIEDRGERLEEEAVRVKVCSGRPWSAVDRE